MEYGLAVETIFDQVELFRDHCHRTIEPVWPLSETVVPVPLQTALVVGVAVPPTEIGLMLAVVVLEVEVQPLTVTVTLYVPPAAVVTLGIDGFWDPEVKLFGPVQL